MPRMLRRIIKRLKPAAERETRPAVVQALDIPLLHPSVSYDFIWGGRTCTVHASRKRPGEVAIHGEWFYLQLPDGSFHEVQYGRLRSHLEHPPELATTVCIARAFEKEGEQSEDHLRQLAKACGL